MEQERYEIVKLLGKGRTGGVYEAEDTVLGRRVAMRRFFDTQGDSDHTGWQDQFVEIATSLCAIQHPGIATVFDAGVDGDGAYIISQLLSGEPLSDRLQQGPINEWDVYQMTESILDAMSVAHEAGFIHGAFNPSSIMRVPRASGGYRSIIVDMGLNRLAPLIQGANSSFALMAEPTMMAPEQFDGTPATVQSDLYMVGQFTYICLIGGHPFGGKSLDEAAEAHRSERLRPLYKYDSGVSRELSDWVDKLIEKDPTKRPQTVREAMEYMPRLTKPGDYNKRSKFSGAAPSNLSNGPATSLTEGNKSATASTHLNAPILNAAASLNMGTAAPIASHTPAQVAKHTTSVQHIAAPVGLGGRNPGLPSPQQKKSIIGLILGVIAGVALLGGGIIVVTSGWSTSPDDTTNTDESGDTENPVIKTPKVNYSTGAKFAKPVFVAKLGSNKDSAEVINLSGAQDWLCVRAKGKGTQPWKTTKKDGLYLSGVEYHGGTRGVPHDFYSVGFKDGTETYFSKLLVSSMNNNLAITNGSVGWSYLNITDGVDPAVADTDFKTTWYNSTTGGYTGGSYNGPKFTSSAQAPFHYGGVEGLRGGTVLTRPDSGKRYTTYYYKIIDGGDRGYKNLDISLLADDGAFVYLNGVLIGRDGVSNPDTFMQGSSLGDESNFDTLTLIGNPVLQPGPNLLAISVHNTNTTSSDLGFDLSISGDPVLVAENSTEYLKEGGGFRILGQVPRDHNGALKGRVYFTSYNAKVQVDYHISGRTPDATSYGYYSPSSGEVGACYFLDFECSNPEPGSEFEVIVFSRGAEKAGKIVSLILNGIVIK